MFFAAFCLTSSTELVPLNGDPTAKRGGVTGRPDEGLTFQHDNGPTYKAKIVQNWLKRWARREGIVLPDWPPYSPDLNPIENLWKIIKDRLCARYPELATLPRNEEALDRLIEAAQEIWGGLEEEVFENLVNSMPQRIKDLHEARGWYTKY
ncbi:hypothetical protein FZEAL_10099 [Fusarium zealandicum]|uniref:Tc1-like transposase DDE domain-containing protein n=1 Tax=Fusarium zealandicum TaxID=1053134 RepID=A0A8H4U618_9HYPO|nr:hypothetical protein FZEAL_10099 [Fusarium zealandicum]